MCGIIGIVDFVNPILVSKKAFSDLVSMLAHRGPDSSGIVTDPQFLFGHTRLSVIDFSSSADQPMFDSKNEICIIYNGEVYNFEEIRSELILQGAAFRTHSDTEVIIEAYKYWGIDFLEKLNGMFAAAIFDKPKNRCYLIRDRLGVKPLYYSFVNNCLSFSSEVKGIIFAPGFERAINLRAVSGFLSFRQPVNNETFFENIYMLPAGHYMEYCIDGFEVKPYWRMQPKKRTSIFWLKQQLAQIKKILSDAVRLTLAGDVKPACFLSGGIDSTIILHEMRNHISDEISTFTVTFEEKDYNESSFSRLVAKKYQAKNIEILVGADEYINCIRSLIRCKDAPLGMHNEVALYLLSKEVRKNSKVALSGEGSDELFGGYGRIFRLYFDIERAKILRWFPSKMRSRILKKIHLSENDLKKSPVDFFLSRYEYFPRKEKYSIFNEEVKKILNNDKFIDEFVEKEFSTMPGHHFKDQVLWFFQKFHLHGLLSMMDAMSMAASLEVRFPFVDHRLIESVLGMPFKYKIKWKSWLSCIRACCSPVYYFSEKEDTTKYLLKKLYKDDIPSAVIERKKMVFPVPLKEWFGDAFSDYVKLEVTSNNSKCAQFFDLEKLRNWMDSKSSIDDPLYGRKIWMILNLELWLKEYFP